MRLIASGAVFFLTGAAARAQPIACKLIVDPLERLHCFDTEATATSISGALQKITVSILSSPPAIAAIVAAIIALIGSIWGPWVQLKIGKRQAAAAQTAATASQAAAAASQSAADASLLTARNIGNREIARLRMAWINELRQVLADYHAILMSIRTFLPGSEMERTLYRQGTLLDLLLNQNNELQKALWDVSEKIFQTEDIGQRQAMDKELIDAGRAVFDAEWKTIKNEMSGG
jgi:hypothetical protein